MEATCRCCKNCNLFKIVAMLCCLAIAVVMALQQLVLIGHDSADRSRVQMVLIDVSTLISEYTNEQLRSGEWPSAESMYAMSSKLMTSESVGDKRIDTFQYLPDGPWLQFELHQSGAPQIWARVIWSQAELDHRRERLVP